MKKSRLSINISNFESITENTSDNLIGGFSKSFSFEIDNIMAGANNCQGGNCVEGCGDGQNVNCNTVAGCKKETL